MTISTNELFLVLTLVCFIAGAIADKARFGLSTLGWISAGLAVAVLGMLVA